MSVWLGGLSALVASLPRATRELEPPQRSRLLAACLARFSQIALISVGTILATGLIQAYVYVRNLDNLVNTQYGVAVLIKFCLLIALIGLGAYNRTRSVPRLERIAGGGESPGRAGILLRRALRAEVALIVVVLGVTGALASYAPAISLYSGPYSNTTMVGPIQLETTVDPARTGSNQIHLYLFNANSGAPFTGTKQLTVSASLPGKQISLPLTPQLSGPGHYTIQGVPLAPAGDWELSISDRVSAFNEYQTQLKVPIK